MTQTQEQRIIANPQNYLSLEGRQHGIYSYQNLAVELYRLGHSPEIKELSLNFGPRNTAKEANGHQYIENITHSQALDLNQSLNNQTPTPRQFVDFLNELQLGIQGKKAVLDASGNPIPIRLLQQTLDEIRKQRAPWRAEWLNQGYLKRGKDLYVRSFVTHDRSLNPIEAHLEDCLMKDRQIDIFDWLARANTQGLPPRDVEKGNLFYWYPREGAVAWFRADADMVGLDCDRDPQGSNAGLGVRAAISIGNISTKIFQEKSRLEEALEDIQGCIAPDLLPKVQEKLKKYF